MAQIAKVLDVIITQLEIKEGSTPQIKNLKTVVKCKVDGQDSVIEIETLARISSTDTIEDVQKLIKTMLSDVIGHLP